MTKKRKKKRARDDSGALPTDWARSVADSIGGAEVQANAIPEGKMSDIVADYAAPLIDEFAEYEEDIVYVLQLGCLFWNMAVVRSLENTVDPKTEQALMKFLREDPYFLTPAGALNLIGDMMQRWDQDYSWYRRIILDKQIELRDDGPHLSIVSAPIDEEE